MSRPRMTSVSFAMTEMLQFCDEPSRTVSVLMTPDRFSDPDSRSELDGEFWGEQSEWTPQPRPSADRAGAGATIGRWWNGLLGGSEPAERSHGRPHPGRRRRCARGAVREVPGTSRTSHDPVEADDEAWSFDTEPESSQRPEVDPLIARLGGLAVIVTLAAPLVLGFTSSGSDSAADTGRSPSATATATATESSTASTTPGSLSTIEPSTLPTLVVSAASTAVAPAAASTDAAGTTSPGATTEPAYSAPAPATAALAASTESQPEPTPTVPVVTTPPCGARYELAAGDYWIRIADAADVSLADLLSVNDASVDTVLVPGRSICLPVGASTPAPPATTPAPRRRRPGRHARHRRLERRPPPRRRPPRHPLDRAAVPQSQATDIIRSVWPDDLEARALEIAWRESNHRSDVSNWCCHGLFQIHWKRTSQLARHHRRDVGDAAVRPAGQRRCCLHAVSACGRLGSLGRLNRSSRSASG